MARRYYFDASDAGPTDPSSNWVSDADAFNGVATDGAASVSTDSGFLSGTGTTAPATGGAGVASVTALLEDSFGISTGQLLDSPSGGWTWAKVQALHVEFDYLSSAAVMRVYESDGGTLLGTEDGNSTSGVRVGWLDVELSGIVLPLNEETDLYDYQSNGGGTTLTFTVPTGVSDDDYLLIMAAGDDNDITWSPPSTTAGCDPWVEFFEVNDAGGDDASIGGWYCLVTTAATASGESVALVRSGSEELAGVMIVVQGADTTDFEDLAFVEGTHFVSTQNVDGTPNITPQPITTITDDAVVIILTGNRSHASHLNTDTEIPANWEVIAPAGYTIESDADPTQVNGVNSEGAPGRLEQGQGNGDAQQSWMWKTVGTAGTETPGDITGFSLGRDMKTATFAIRPAAAGGASTSGTLNGGGSISATVTSTRDVSATLNGGGSISETHAKTAERTATLNGGGSIAATAAKKVERAITLNGGGSIAATFAPSLEVQVTLNGGGSITAAVAHKASVAETLNGGGSIAAVVAPSKPVTATLNGGGSIIPTAAHVGDKSAVLNGGGSIAATVVKFETGREVSATLNGGGSIAATAAQVHTTTATLNGGGSIAVIAASTREAAVTLNGGGSITPTVAPTKVSAVELNGGGSVAATVVKHEGGREVSATLNGGGSISATVVTTRDLDVTLNGGGSVTPAVSHVGVTASVLNGGGSIAPVAASARSVAVTLNGGGSIAATVVPAEFHSTPGPTRVLFNDDFDRADSTNIGAAWVEDGTGDAEILSNVLRLTNDGVQQIDVQTASAVVGNNHFVQATQLALNGSVSQHGLIVRSNGTDTFYLASYAGNSGAVAYRLKWTIWQVTGDAFTPIATVAHAEPSNGDVIRFQIIGSNLTLFVNGVPVLATTDTAITTGGHVGLRYVQSLAGPRFVEWDDFAAGDAALNGGGSISATVTKKAESAATLNGGGSIAATVKKVQSVAVELNGGGSIAAVSTSARTSTPILNGGGSIAATVVKDTARTTSGTLNGGGSITAIATNPVRDTAATLNGGGSVTAGVTTHRFTRAFPDLGEGLMGPALNGGGSIEPTYVQQSDGTTSAELNGGGSITVVVAAFRTTSAELNGGGSISAATQEKETSAILRGGGSIVVAILSAHTTSATLRGGGSITVPGPIIVPGGRAYPDDDRGFVGSADQRAAAIQARRSSSVRPSSSSGRVNR